MPIVRRKHVYGCVFYIDGADIHALSGKFGTTFIICYILEYILGENESYGF